MMDRSLSSEGRYESVHRDARDERVVRRGLDGGSDDGHYAAIAPKFVQLTNDVVFDDLWRRSDLNPRDRSLATIAVLAATGDDDQLDFYLRRGIESGLTRAQITEALTHLGFYAGWSKATKAMAAVTRTLGK